MIKDKNSYYYQDRNLSEVFMELQEIKNNAQISYIQNSNQRKRFHIKRIFSSKTNNIISRIESPHVIMFFIIIFAFVALFCNKNILAKSNEYEINNNVLNIQNIISENANIDTFKEQSITEYNLVSPIVYTNNPSLPKGEEVVTKEGTLGKEKVLSVKTYQNQQLVDEHVLSREKISDPTPQLVDVGTSELLAKYKVHIGDTLYTLEDCTFKESADKKSKDLATIKKNLDVKLLELSSNENWCKVSFDNVDGYIQSSKLTSASLTPDIVEKNRIQRILLEVNIDMELNQSSNLTKDDYKKIFTGLSQDTNSIFEDNYEVFYDMDKKYNINGIFLASIAIHESNWGTSTIANDKKNLFGYGSYDRNPYEYSYQFSEYSDGIETVAKALAKYYLNPVGTKICDDEFAEGTYYNEPTVKGVNIRYASDEEWHSKVFRYMELLYNQLVD